VSDMKVEVPKGYKKTKVGVIPEDWEVVQIKDVTDYVDYRGKTPKKVENGIVLVTARNIKQGYLDYETSQEYIAKDDYFNVMSRGIPKNGDVLLTTEAPLGNVAQIDNENIALAQRVIKFRAKNSLKNTYLKYHFLSEKFQSYLHRLAIGTTVLGIQGKQLHKMNIPLPPLKEQQKIAEILTTWESAISKQEELVKAKEELKKGLMQKLLSGEVRFDGFNEEWEEVRLEKIGKVIRGVSYKPNDLFVTDTDKTVRLMRSNNIKSGYLDRNTELQYVNNTKVKKIQNLINGDLVICMANGSKNLVGKNGEYVSIDQYIYTIGAFCAIFRFNDDVIRKFIKYIFQSEQYSYYVQNLLAGSNINNLKGSDIETMKFKVPISKQEQQKIAQVLSNSDKEITLLKEELKAVKEQKRGLMQRLLTGKVRVKA